MKTIKCKQIKFVFKVSDIKHISAYYYILAIIVRMHAFDSADLLQFRYKFVRGFVRCIHICVRCGI